MPKTVPKRLPSAVIQQPTATKSSKENGPEINNLRPVPYVSAALANHRLQPLGHLTEARKLSINEIAVYAPGDCPLDCP